MLFDEFLFRCPRCGYEFIGDSLDLDDLYCPNCGRWIRPFIVEKLFEGIL